MAGALFLASGLAAWAVTRRQPSLRSLSALLPQQVLLTLSAYAATAAVIAGHYGDGLPRPRLFILADQAPAILALILHTAAVIEIHARTPDSEVLRITFEAIGAEQERFRQTLPEKGSMPDECRPDRIFSRIEKTDELLAEIRPSSCSKRGGFSEASGPQVARGSAGVSFCGGAESMCGAHRAGHGRHGHLRRYRSPAPPPHRHPGTRTGTPDQPRPAEFGMIPRSPLASCCGATRRAASRGAGRPQHEIRARSHISRPAGQAATTIFPRRCPCSR